METSGRYWNFPLFEWKIQFIRPLALISSFRLHTEQTMVQFLFINVHFIGELIFGAIGPPDSFPGVLYV